MCFILLSISPLIFHRFLCFQTNFLFYSVFVLSFRYYLNDIQISFSFSFLSFVNLFSFHSQKVSTYSSISTPLFSYSPFFLALFLLFDFQLFFFWQCLSFILFHLSSSCLRLFPHFSSSSSRASSTPLSHQSPLILSFTLLLPPWLIDPCPCVQHVINLYKCTHTHLNKSETHNHHTTHTHLYIHSSAYIGIMKQPVNSHLMPADCTFGKTFVKILMAKSW